jgi:hypothetical protein
MMAATTMFFAAFHFPTLDVKNIGLGMPPFFEKGLLLSQRQ